MLLIIFLIILVLFFIYVSILVFVRNVDNLQVFHKSRTQGVAAGPVWSGPCGLQCITDAALGSPEPGLAHVCVCQSCVCDLVSSVIRPNETLELIHGALESFCDVACTQAKSVVDYLTTQEVPREVAGVLRAEVQSDRQQRPFNAAPTFSDRIDLVPPRTTRPDQDRVQPGDLARLEQKLEKLTKVILKRNSAVENKAEAAPPKIEKTAESPTADDDDSDDIPRVGLPTSSHASTSRKSCHSCMEDNTVCLGECPNAKKYDNDDKSIKSAK